MYFAYFFYSDINAKEETLELVDILKRENLSLMTELQKSKQEREDLRDYLLKLQVGHAFYGISLHFILITIFLFVVSGGE